MPTHALYNPDLGVTEGGLCLSAFVLLRKADKVYVVRPADDARWKDDWAPNLRIYAPDALARQWGLLRFPAAYLREGEHPDAAVQRVLREQLRLDGARILQTRVHSFYGESRRFPGVPHWDLVFVAEAVTQEEPHPGRWVAEGAWRAPATLKAEEFGSAHGDLLGLLRGG